MLLSCYKGDKSQQQKPDDFDRGAPVKDGSLVEFYREFVPEYSKIRLGESLDSVLNLFATDVCVCRRTLRESTVSYLFCIRPLCFFEAISSKQHTQYILNSHRSSLCSINTTCRHCTHYRNTEGQRAYAGSALLQGAWSHCSLHSSPLRGILL